MGNFARMCERKQMNHEEISVDVEETLYNIIDRQQKEIYSIGGYAHELEIAIWHDCLKPEDACMNGTCEQHNLLMQVRREMQQRARGQL